MSVGKMIKKLGAQGNPSEIVLPDRVIKRQRPRNLRTEDQHLFAHEYEVHLPSTSHHRLGPVTASGLSVFDWANPLQSITLSYPWGKRTEAILRSLNRSRPALFRSRQTLDQGVWISDQWSRNYFHWITDALPRVGLARQLGVSAPLVIPEFVAQRAHVIESLNWLGENWLLADEGRHLKVAKLHMFSPLAPTGNPDPYLIDRLRDTLLAPLRSESSRANEDKTSAPERIWVSRQKTRRRRISNEGQIRDLIEKNGFLIVYPEDLNFAEQVELFSSAKVIAGLHGAGLTNMVFMEEGSTVCEVRRFGDFHNNSFFALADAAGHNYRYLLTQPGAHFSSDGDCIVDGQELGRVLDQLGS